MILLRIILFVLLALDSAGLVGLLITLYTSMFEGDAPIWVGLVVLVGAGVAFGWMLKRAGRPGVACLPAALVLPIALYGIGIGLFILGSGGHH